MVFKIEHRIDSSLLLLRTDFFVLCLVEAGDSSSGLKSQYSKGALH